MRLLRMSDLIKELNLTKSAIRFLVINKRIERYINNDKSLRNCRYLYDIDSFTGTDRRPQNMDGIDLYNYIKENCNINIDTGCWEWNRYLNKSGYGRIIHKGNNILLHRLMFQLKYGEFDSNLFVCHKCDNPKCCNPEHLFLGTAFDNNLDKKLKGRDKVKEDNPAAKLRNEDVINIRNLYKEGNITQKELAKIYNVHPANICRIINNKIWQGL